MRRLLLLITTSFITVNLFSQCPAPVVDDWTSAGSGNFTVFFTAETDGTYHLEITTDYGTPGDIGFDTLLVTGDAVTGANEISVEIPVFNFNIDLVYFTAALKLECSSGDFSEEDKFYLSHHSLTHESGFLFANIYEPFEPLPDGAGQSYQTSWVIPDNGEVIESLAVFIDIGHTYNGDLEMTLIHPNGTEITLMSYPNGQGGSWGFSVVFSDLATENFGPSSGGLPGPRGIFLPEESFSSLIGEPIAGQWILTVTDNLAIDDGMVFGVSLDVDGTFCAATLQGEAFVDMDGDQEFNEGDYPYPFPLIFNSIGNNAFIGAESGSFFSCSAQGSGTLELTNYPEYFTTSPIDVTLDAGDILDDLVLSLVPEADVLDLSIDLFTLDPNRPGFPATYHIQAQNIGTLCEDNASLSISFPEYVSITSSTNDDLIFSENSAQLDMIELCPFESVNFNIEVLLDDTVSLGTILSAVATISPTEGDADANNNQFTSEVEVVGSYDPNDKQVSTETITDEFIADNTQLRYTVRFQNTGTFYAERVVIVDTMDVNLNIQTLNILSASHDMEVLIEENVVSFEFDQIFLPDSTTDLEGSQGYVRYEIDPVNTFSEGQDIENTAYIYFDFNAPIITNTVQTIYQNPLSVSNTYPETRLFPNPVSRSLMAMWNHTFEPNRVEVFDLAGRKLIEEKILSTNSMELDVSILPPGLYIIRFSDGELASENKFVKTVN